MKYLWIQTKFVFEVRHNKADTNKANEIIADLKKMARDRGFDMRDEIDIKINLSSQIEEIEIYPTIYFYDGEFYPKNAQDFTADYLLKYTNQKGVFVDFGQIIDLDTHCIDSSMSYIKNQKDFTVSHY